MKREKIDILLKPAERFMRAESGSGMLLLISAVLALAWANSPWAEQYHHLWEYDFSIRLGDYGITKSLHHWINDGLMAIFFFVVGLELKREIIAGELSSLSKAAFPLAAAAGGMVVPALIFLYFNPDAPASAGWGIPMATDIAFALGIVALLGRGVPASVKVFLTALAIADDLGAVLVIAFFYTSDISLVNLGVGVLFIAMLVTANFMGVRKPLFYGIVGIAGLWLAFLMSGVHATIAGVLAAMTIPARTRIDEKKFIEEIEQRIHEFRQIPPNDVTLLEPEQYKTVKEINNLTEEADTPLQRLEHDLHPWVSYLVMPIFAFANAGITLSGDIFDLSFFQGISMGVFAGLVVGKFVGVAGISWLMQKIGWGRLPDDMNRTHLLGVSLIAGIGFTMSLFITDLAYEQPGLIVKAKTGVFAASIVSGLLGYAVLKRASRRS